MKKKVAATRTIAAAEQMTISVAEFDVGGCFDRDDRDETLAATAKRSGPTTVAGAEAIFTSAGEIRALPRGGVLSGTLLGGTLLGTTAAAAFSVGPGRGGVSLVEGCSGKASRV